MSYFRGPWEKRKNLAGRRKSFCDLVSALTLFDLGAAGGTPPPFLFLGDDLQVVTFEPEPEADVAASGINCPVAVGPREFETLFINRRPTTSSLLRPNRSVVGRYDWESIFGGQGDIFETVKELAVETIPLDDAIVEHELPDPDFLKIDVQGLTYEVLEGAGAALADSVLGIQVEMEFSECYLGQKTFGAVHEFLLEAGFEVFGLSNLNRWPFRTRRKARKPRGQDTFCDMTYFKIPERVGSGPLGSVEGLRKMAGLLLLFDFNDAALAYLERGEEAGLVESADPLFDLAVSWPGSLDYFYEARLLDRLTTIGSTSLLDISLRKCVRAVKRVLR